MENSNNNWNKINTINDLPTERGMYHVCKNGIYVGEFYLFNAFYRKKEMMQFSHWKPKQKIKGPNE